MLLLRMSGRRSKICHSALEALCLHICSTVGCIDLSSESLHIWLQLPLIIAKLSQLYADMSNWTETCGDFRCDEIVTMEGQVPEMTEDGSTKASFSLVRVFCQKVHLIEVSACQ